MYSVGRALQLINYVQVQGCCAIDDPHGDVVNAHRDFNKLSYSFRTFAKPDPRTPWAFAFFGHHVCLASLVLDKRMVLCPTSLGVQPKYIDEEPPAMPTLTAGTRAGSIRVVDNQSTM